MLISSFNILSSKNIVLAFIFNNIFFKFNNAGKALFLPVVV